MTCGMCSLMLAGYTFLIVWAAPFDLSKSEEK